MTQYDYDAPLEIKVTFKIDEVNAYLKKGWRICDHQIILDDRKIYVIFVLAKYREIEE